MFSLYDNFPPTSFNISKSGAIFDIVILCLFVLPKSVCFRFTIICPQASFNISNSVAIVDIVILFSSYCQSVCVFSLYDFSSC